MSIFKLPTICAKCDHHKRLTDNLVRRHIWYNQICTKGNKRKCNYVTGYNEDDVTYCRDINRVGQCLDYSPIEFCLEDLVDFNPEMIKE